MYHNISLPGLGNPLVVADRFHFSRYIYWALERVRRQEQKNFHDYDRKKCKRRIDFWHFISLYVQIKLRSLAIFNLSPKALYPSMFELIAMYRGASVPMVSETGEIYFTPK